MVIGVDFDNTIADYDDLMHAIAVERGLIAADSPKSKKLIRDAIRALPDGESHWRGVQVTAYGPRMHEAKLIEGVRQFFLECKRLAVPVYIVSHKTEFANFGDAKANLREAARAWLELQGFFDESGIALKRENVFFEATRAEKIERVKLLGATHFIDDLEETFEEAAFPHGVEKILFASYGQPKGSSDTMSFPSWREIHDRVLDGVSTESLARLTGAPVRSVTRVGRGGNSKVYRVVAGSGAVYAAKFYFQRTIDGLDRLEVEYTSLEFLHALGERAVPRPIAVDRDLQIALYEFVEGAPIDSAAAGDREIQSMVEFAKRLKKLSSSPEAAKLPRAAEACFCFDDLEENIRGRLARLEAVEGETPSYRKLQEFLASDVGPVFDVAVERVRTALSESEVRTPLPRSKRTLSASDFGFHNALRRGDGSLLVLDLEYFGWDDPAKLISDFVLHPAMNLPYRAKEQYVSEMLEVFSDDESLQSRLSLSYPLFAIKWCTILLNEFVSDFIQRREFAVRATVDRESMRLAQLEKAKKVLAHARECLDSISFLSVRKAQHPINAR